MRNTLQNMALLVVLTGTVAFGLTRPAPVSAQSAGVLEFLWQSEGGPAPLGYPYGPGIAPDGNLWVADSPKDNFQIFAPDGTFLSNLGRLWFGSGAVRIS